MSMIQRKSYLNLEGVSKNFLNKSYKITSA